MVPEKDARVEPAVESRPGPASRKRLQALDAARVFATFAIVWTHVSESQGQSLGASALGRFGTSFYIIVAMLFIVRGAVHHPDRRFFDDVRTKARRLLWPYLLWSMIYGLYYGYHAYTSGHTWAGLTQWWGPVAGTAVHLWFLPFVFFWGSLSALVVPWLLKLPLKRLAVGSVILSAVTYAFCFKWLFYALNRFWLWDHKLHRLDRWVEEIPLVVTAVLGAVLFHRQKASVRAFLREKKSALAGLFLGGFVLIEWAYFANNHAIQLATQSEGRFFAHAAGLLLLSAVLCLGDTALIARLSTQGRYTYVAFLVHVLVIEAFRDPTKSWPGYGGLLFALLSTIGVFTVSLGLSHLIARVHYFRVLRP